MHPRSQLRVIARYFYYLVRRLQHGGAGRGSSAHPALRGPTKAQGGAINGGSTGKDSTARGATDIAKSWTGDSTTAGTSLSLPVSASADGTRTVGSGNGKEGASVDDPPPEKMGLTVLKHKGNAWSRGSSAIINAAAQSVVSKSPASIALVPARGHGESSYAEEMTASCSLESLPFLSQYFPLSDLFRCRLLILRITPAPKRVEGGGKKQPSSTAASHPPAPLPRTAPATEVLSSAPTEVPPSPARKSDLKRCDQPATSQSQQSGTSFSLGKYGSSSGASDGDTEGFFFGFGDTIGDAATWSAPSSSAGGWGDVVGAGDGADDSKQEAKVVPSSSAPKEENTTGVAVFFEKGSADGLETSKSKKSEDVNGKVSMTSSPPGLASAPSPAKMLSVEEIEAENEGSTESKNAAPSGSVGPPPSTEPQASAAVPVVPRSAPTAPPTAPVQPAYHYVHPGGGAGGYGNNSLNTRAGKKFSNRGKNNSSMAGVQQGNPGYPAMMQYGMYGQDPNSMLYTISGPYGSPGMMQVQPSQLAGHSSGALDGSVVGSSGVGASAASSGANTQGMGSDISVNGAGMPANGVGNNSVQQPMQYQTQPGMIQAYSGMGAAFPHPPQQMGSGYAAAYQMGGMYGAPAGWNGGYPNQFAQVGYAPNPNAGGRGPVGFAPHSANGAVARMQGYGGMDPSGQGYAYGMAGNMDYNAFGGHHHGPGKGGHKSKTTTSNRNNHHNHSTGSGSNTTATGGVGASDYSKGGGGSSGGTEGRVGGGNSQDVRASMSRGANSNASLHGGATKSGNSLEAGLVMGSVNASSGVASGASSNGTNGGSNNWNTSGQDMLWAQQQMQYQQQMAMMNGQYQQQQAPYQQNSGYGTQANWR